MVRELQILQDLEQDWERISNYNDAIMWSKRYSNVYSMIEMRREEVSRSLNEINRKKKYIYDSASAVIRHAEDMLDTLVKQDAQSYVRGVIIETREIAEKIIENPDEIKPGEIDHILSEIESVENKIPIGARGDLKSIISSLEKLSDNMYDYWNEKRNIEEYDDETLREIDMHLDNLTRLNEELSQRIIHERRVLDTIKRAISELDGEPLFNELKQIKTIVE